MDSIYLPATQILICLINIITLNMPATFFLKFHSKEMMNTNKHMDEERLISELKCSNTINLKTGIRIIFTALQCRHL